MSVLGGVYCSVSQQFLKVQCVFVSNIFVVIRSHTKMKNQIFCQKVLYFEKISNTLYNVIFFSARAWLAGSGQKISHQPTNDIFQNSIFFPGASPPDPHLLSKFLGENIFLSAVFRNFSVAASLANPIFIYRARFARAKLERTKVSSIREFV